MNEAERLAALAADPDAPPLLVEMIGLRKALRNQRNRDRAWRAALLLGILAALLLWNGQRNATNAIVAARTQGRAATCSLFQAYTDALVQSGSPPATQGDHDQLQARVDGFVAYLNSKSGAINCVLVAPQVQPVFTTQPGGTP